MRFTHCLVAALVLACSPQPTEPVSPDDGEVDWCPQACQRWVGAGCADEQVCVAYDEPDPVCIEWTTCEAWCRQVVLEAPPGAVFHPQCVATAEPPADVDDFCWWLDEECSQ